MALIECKNASFGYDGGVVLANIGFSLESGEYLCVLGENGSGKSTLIKGLLRLKAPVSGEVKYGDGLLANQIGYLPQQTAAQKDFPATVFEVALSGRLNKCAKRPFYSREDKNDAWEKLELMGMDELADRCYAQLSGGQQQRVLLARALCATTKLILLDEPVSGLDPIVTQEMYALISKVHSEQGITVIMVSHDTAAVDYSTRILHLGHKQLFFGPTEEYKNSALGKRFLGGEDNA